MVEVFITDIQNEIQAENISRTIILHNLELKINFDLNETNFPFPCGHTILRIEGNTINSDIIMETVRSYGFNCKILEDTICTQSRFL
jgi:hypothetical protein